MHVKALGCAYTKGRSESICHAYSTVYRLTLNGKTDSEPEQDVQVSDFPPSVSPLWCISPHMKSSNYLKGQVFLYWPSKELIYLDHWCTSYIKGSDGNFWKQVCPFLPKESHQRASWFVFRNSLLKFRSRQHWGAAVLKWSDHSQMSWFWTTVSDCWVVHLSASQLPNQISAECRAEISKIEFKSQNEKQQHFTLYFHQSCKRHKIWFPLLKLLMMCKALAQNQHFLLFHQ